jgi:hypothetical protein
MDYIPHADWLQLVLLLITVTTFGFWPLFRSLNGAPVLLFARINILSQFGFACVYALVFEGPHRIVQVFENFDVRVGFVLLGGFCLGHGDQCTAIPMKYLQPGITTALVGMISLLLTCVFNYIQVGAAQPIYVFSGLVSALIALFLLSQTVKKSSRQELKEERRLEKDRKKYPGFKSGVNPLLHNQWSDSVGWGEATRGTNNSFISEASSSSLLSVPGITGSGYLTYTKEAYKMTNFQPELSMSKRKGLAIMFVAGLFTACWGPMSTYARNGNPGDLVRSPGIMVFLFTLGEVLALPDLYLICLCIEPQPEYKLTWRKLFWGITNGLGIITGYFFFFTSTYYNMVKIVVPGTVIANCNPLVAVLIDIVRGEFTGSPLKTKILLVMAVTLYFGAVFLNALSAT